MDGTQTQVDPAKVVTFGDLTQVLASVKTELVLMIGSELQKLRAEFGPQLEALAKQVSGDVASLALQVEQKITSAAPAVEQAAETVIAGFPSFHDRLVSIETALERFFKTGSTNVAFTAPKAPPSQTAAEKPAS